MQDDMVFDSRGRSRITADLYENQLKRGGVNLNYCNHYQMNMVSSSKTESLRLKYNNMGSPGFP